MLYLETNESENSYINSLNNYWAILRVRRFIAPEGVVIPNEFLCPITLEIMQDPVIASDGNTYERFAILQHISMDIVSPLSPLTRNPLQSNILISNNNLMKMIGDFCNSS